MKNSISNCGGAQNRPAGALVLLGVVVGALALGGCGVNRTQTADVPEMSNDARLRHPILLAQGEYTLDVFPAGGALDRRTRGQIEEFARKYRKIGQGPIRVQTPVGGRAPGGDVTAIRHALAYAGAGAAPVSVSSYPVADPALSAPVRLSFAGVKAQVATQCGQWPSDLASGSSTRGWDNKPYYNFGCANQNMIATQVADPRDIAGPRAEDPTDLPTRIKGVEKMRAGSDPSIGWSTPKSSIGSIN